MHHLKKIAIGYDNEKKIFIKKVEFVRMMTSSRNVRTLKKPILVNKHFSLKYY